MDFEGDVRITELKPVGEVFGGTLLETDRSDREMLYRDYGIIAR